MNRRVPRPGRRGLASLAGAALLLMPGFAEATEAEATEATVPDAEALMREAHLNMYYPGADGSARVAMTITDKRGKTREREFTILRRDWEEGGEQRYYVYFHRPNDVRRTTFMAWKDPHGDDSRWIYVPSLDLVKPISANDKKSSFVGSDFAYEDVSGRHWSGDEHSLLRRETLASEALGEREAFVVESRPKSEDYFARKVTWIDAETRLVLREEYYDTKDRELKIFETLAITTVDGVVTASQRRMTTPRKSNETLIEFSDIAYDLGLGESIFTERYLKSPPSQYVQ